MQDCLSFEFERCWQQRKPQVLRLRHCFRKDFAQDDSPELWFGYRKYLRAEASAFFGALGGHGMLDGWISALA